MYTTPATIAGAPSMALPVLNRHLTSSISGSLTSIRPVIAGSPRKTGQSAEAVAAKAATSDNSPRERIMVLLERRSQGSLVQLQDIRFGHGPWIEAGSPLLVGLVGEYRQ